MSQVKKIAFLCHPYHRGGVTRWMADAAIDYADKGYEVYFATPEPMQEFYSGKGRETMVQLLSKSNNKVKLVTCKVGRAFEFGNPEYCAYVYKKLLADYIPAGIPIILSDDKTVWQAAVSLHVSYPLVGVLHADEEAYYTLAKRFQKEVDIFVCVSDKVNKTVSARIPEIGAARIFTIPCGINIPEAKFRNHAGDVLQLMYAGRITAYQKRAGDLLKVAKLLKAKNIPFTWNIIGDGGDFKIALEQQVYAEGLKDNVIFRGWLSQSEVHEYMLGSDVLVLTSEFEGMPIAMMEGLSSGCGFVGTRVSGIEDYEHHPLAKDCFGVFEVGDIEDAVNKILQVAAVPLKTRQHAARQLAEEQFSMDTCLNNYNAAIITIADKQYSKPTASLAPFVSIKSRVIAMMRSVKMALRSK